MKTDRLLRAALKEVTKESVVLVVAQRINTIRDAEQIIVLDQGKIVGRGTHYELLKRCKVYLEIAKSQFSDEELAAELTVSSKVGALEVVQDREKQKGEK